MREFYYFKASMMLMVINVGYRPFVESSLNIIFDFYANYHQTIFKH